MWSRATLHNLEGRGLDIPDLNNLVQYYAYSKSWHANILEISA